MARKGHEPQQEPTAQSHGEEMMMDGVRPHRRKGKRGGGKFGGRFGGRKHSRKDGKRY